MTDIAVPPALATDPNGRDPARTPMQWDMSLVVTPVSSSGVISRRSGR